MSGHSNSRPVFSDSLDSKNLHGDGATEISAIEAGAVHEPRDVVAAFEEALGLEPVNLTARVIRAVQITRAAIGLTYPNQSVEDELARRALNSPVGQLAIDKLTIKDVATLIQSDENALLDALPAAAVVVEKEPLTQAMRQGWE